MRITARVRNAAGGHEVVVATGGAKKTVAIAAKAAGRGSAINGGELLLLALATCYCNDLFREAGKRGLPLDSVEVEVDGDFGGEGEPARRIEYRAKVKGPAPEADLLELLAATDRVAEIQNTVRQGMRVTLTQAEAAST